ncbi:MAG TPA: hypothetical protein VK738_17905 [Terriglobales bacterium]|jgi:hypothetical protein|nr:hypothetical protein [Terriglobales bacterium]
MAGMAVQQPHPESSIRDEVIEVLRGHEMTPSELIANLAKEKSLSDVAIRVAIWYLISQNAVEFSADQKLRLVPTI